MNKEPVTLAVGEKAPDFNAQITNGDQIKLSDILLSGQKVILYFYPKDSTPGCTVQACDFRDNFSRLQKSGYKVIGVSKDSSSSHQKFIDKHELPFDLIVDSETELHQLYGVWREPINHMCDVVFVEKRGLTVRSIWECLYPHLLSIQMVL